ncbi:hypothetical protein MA16_Dca005567 [Dendrobium catenatum]|uniref:Vacuolar protein sorting-associated protein 54 N-terminal domain-containing protein n=1 Tax=Dendrobium catenatum TaxID=906689 RepID=A0A2I0WPZ3_9ASPA|nr:hypothetical protein MA16_Dca005567 [Dendrobium catenatum]
MGSWVSCGIPGKKLQLNREIEEVEDYILKNRKEQRRVERRLVFALNEPFMMIDLPHELELRLADGFDFLFRFGDICNQLQVNINEESIRRLALPSKVIDAYALVGDITGFAEKIQSFFMQELLSETYTLLKDIVIEVTFKKLLGVVIKFLEIFKCILVYVYINKLRSIVVFDFHVKRGSPLMS